MPVGTDNHAYICIDISQRYTSLSHIHYYAYHDNVPFVYAIMCNHTQVTMPVGTDNHAYNRKQCVLNGKWLSTCPV